MDKRTSIFTISTILSSLGLIMSGGLVLEIFHYVISGEYKFGKLGYSLLVLVIIPLAWFFYFDIAFKWVENKPVPLKVKVFGSICGIAAVILTAGLGVLLCFPAILLMLYIFVSGEEVNT